ncbi:MAG: hypothetical protein D6760_04595 [Deltaproteobacteria bacterium]|nr:MAG: hypothetical protein D6760_04595 [Deltaproteobacteria bacterium]
MPAGTQAATAFRLAAAALVVAAAGCVVTRSSALPARLDRPGRNCISIRTILDWRASDDYTLELRTNAASNRYRVRLSQRCHSLVNAETVSFSSPDPWLCDHRGDAVLTGREACPIAAIEPIDAPAADPAR